MKGKKEKLISKTIFLDIVRLELYFFKKIYNLKIKMTFEKIYSRVPIKLTIFFYFKFLK